MVECGAGDGGLAVSMETGMCNFPPGGRGRAADGGVLPLPKRFVSGPGGFRADIEDVRAIGFESQGLFLGGIRFEEFSAVGKRVRREVQNAHEEGCRTVFPHGGNIFSIVWKKMEKLFPWCGKSGEPQLAAGKRGAARGFAVLCGGFLGGVLGVALGGGEQAAVLEEFVDIAAVEGFALDEDIGEEIELLAVRGEVSRALA